ncbi:hypothetical protein HYH02_003733 [Chlamydomonas schloesseri]|uniref:Sodium/calcium exchanger membrane region domain-containing protein n=1 Tax=Chlamydomonas schloesseri TaxID=2026947 RepID=A0A836BAC2_9CHLO|nr:hypothetical protein HYH02_003733 [Chlamydomonas schloesseri]|eukprot:KAG2451959.1 hypothetical protein HYH02_003733 [Chlamydomonas schloesseri]
MALAEQAKAEAKAFFLDSWKLNLLMFALPFAFIARYAGWGDGATFSLSCLALVPLAERLGFVTEQLAMYTNDTLGGLLNATFGNATEMIISAFAMIQARKLGSEGGGTFLRVVQLSLLGSVVSNLLLVMGTAFIAGGLKRKSQTFNQIGINVNAGMLVLSTFAIIMPSLLDATHTERRDRKSELALSRFESIFMFLCYCLYLFFQLKTHKHLFEEDKSGGATPAAGVAASGGTTRRTSTNGATTPPVDGAGGPDPEAALAALRSSLDGREVALGGRFSSNGRSGSGMMAVEMVDGPSLATTSAKQRTSSGRSLSKGGHDKEGARDRDVERLPLVLAAERPGGLDVVAGASDDEGDGNSKGGGSDDEEEELILSKTGCFVWLTIVTIFISFLSEFVTDAIRGASKSLGVPMPFLTTILLPIVGNAAEHASAIVFAYKNKVEIALGVAVGSSTQVSMMVVPFCVLLAWTMGLPLDLDFNAFESFVLFSSVLLAVLILQDGHANYLKGVLLVLTYFFISAAFWCHKDPDLTVID